MTEIEDKIIELRNQMWGVARESLDCGETRIYRGLTDILERLTNLIGSSGKSVREESHKENMIPIFARYKGNKYEAQIDTGKIFGEGYSDCILSDGEWMAPSKAAGRITNTKLNGWRHFWKYEKEGRNIPIDQLREVKE